MRSAIRRLVRATIPAVALAVAATVTLAPASALARLVDGTAAEDGDGVTLVGAGDVAVCAYPGDNRTARLLDAIPGRVFVAGDIAYPDGTAAQLRDCYGPTWGRHLDRTSPVIGNHEYHTRAGAPYWDYFGDRAGERGQGWYADDVGSWRVYWLNSNCAEVGCGRSSTQGRWLAADLAAHPNACVAAVMHHPLKSSGEHGNNRAVAPLWAVLDGAGAELVLAGHDHDYERFKRLASTGAPDPDGMRLFVVGTGGAPLRRFERIRNGSVRRQASTHGVLELTLREGGYDWRFVPVEGGSFTDTGSSDCR
jgi:hypothetical protein